jgi:hypothetical protein
MIYIPKPSSEGNCFPKKDNAQPTCAAIVGILVEMPPTRTCPCGSGIMRIGPGRNQHHAGVTCVACGQFGGWLSRESASFVAEVVRAVGVPTKPVQVRI